jgi:O-antigen ligase
MAHDVTFDNVRFPAAAPEASASRARPEERSVAFWGLMMFTFVLLVSPQTLIPGLGVLMPAKIAMGIAIGAYLLSGRHFPVTRTVQWAIAFVGAAIISIPLGFWPGGSVNTFFNVVAKSLVVFLLIASVVDTPRRLKTLIAWMVACGTVAALHAVQQYLSGALDAKGERITGYESPLASNPNDLALTMNILLGLGLGLLPLVRDRSRRLLLLGAMALLLAGVVASFSRGGFVTLGVVGVMWAIQAARTRGLRALAAVALVAAVLAVAAPSAYVNRLSTMFDAEADPTGSAGERWEVMKTALGYIAEQPVFGLGLGNSIHVTVMRGGPAREVHNAYLKTGAELGLLGMTIYTLFVGSAYMTARTVRRRLARRRDGVELASLAGGIELAVVAFAVGALFSPVPYHFYFYYPAGLAVALAVMAAKLEATPHEEPAPAMAADEA